MSNQFLDYRKNKQPADKSVMALAIETGPLENVYSGHRFETI